MMSVSKDWLCLKDVNKGMTEVEQILSEKIEKVKTVVLQKTGQDNYLENDAVWCKRKWLKFWKLK